MIASHQLARPMVLFGRLVLDLEDAAYSIRQHAIEEGHWEAWQLAHRLRRAATPVEAQIAEIELRAWLAARRASTHEPHERVLRRPAPERPSRIIHKLQFRESLNSMRASQIAAGGLMSPPRRLSALAERKP
jgi:hypothetical protein